MPAVNEAIQPLMFLVAAGFVLGLGAFVRGLMSYRRGAAVASIATSPAGALAAGEVRLHGIIEPLVNVLVSPLQSEPAVWYRSRIGKDGDDDTEIFAEERSTQFLLRDDTGVVRIVPRQARWEAPNQLDESTDVNGDPPVGLRRRSGPAATPVTELDREAAIAALLTIRPAGTDEDVSEGSGFRHLGIGSRRHYTEALLAPGDEVTIIGYAQPYSDLSALHDLEQVLHRPDGLDDPVLAAELSEARAAGLLAPTPEAAWGNAAVPGFGIGRPERAPVLDPEADALPLADPGQVERADRLFEIPGEGLVVSSGPDTELVVYAGDPADAKAAHDQTFLMGVGGGALAILSAFAFVVLTTAQTSS
jgi:hypothetical protein